MFKIYDDFYIINMSYNIVLRFIINEIITLFLFLYTLYYKIRKLFINNEYKESYI